MSENSAPTILTMPDNFPKIISDMTSAMTTTFPEYAFMWAKWTPPSPLSGSEFDKDMQQLFEYCVVVYPSRFFDILYQNEDMFLPDSEINTCFLPSVDFKLLFACENITITTRQTLWKYLQLMLFTVSSSIQDKKGFGDAAKTFEGINQDELQEKLIETVTGMTNFFQFLESSKDSSGNSPDVPKSPETDTFDVGGGSFPSAGGDIHEHLRGLFEGKIGSLAKDMAEDISKDFSSILGDDIENIKSTKDVLHKLMQNPGKIAELVKTIGAKLTDKMASGEVSHEELMKEAAGLIGKMKDMGGGNEQFQEIFKNLSKMPGMPKMPKMPNMPSSEDDMDGTLGPTFVKPASSTHASMREKLKARLMQKQMHQQQQRAMEESLAYLQNSGAVPAKPDSAVASSLSASYNIKSTGTPNNFVFSMDDLEKQETTKIGSGGTQHKSKPKPKSKKGKK